MKYLLDTNVSIEFLPHPESLVKQKLAKVDRVTHNRVPDLVLED